MVRDLDTLRAHFFERLKEMGLTVAAVARLSGVPASTLYSYRDGKAQSLLGITQEKIARGLNVTVDDLFSPPSSSRRQIGVWGQIGAGAEVYPYSDYDFEPMYRVTLPPTLDPNEDYVAFEIEGFSMPPAEPGYIAVFRRIELPVESLLGTPCLVDTADGRRLFKRLRKGYTEGRFNLESWDGSPLIEDVEITAALPFAALTPGRKAR